MSLPYCYTQTSLKGLTGEYLHLDEEESFHLCRVLRSRKGDRVILTDGKGIKLEAEIFNPDAKGVLLQVKTDAVMTGCTNYYLHLAIAPTKHPDRLEWFIEKATEVGVDKISLILCEHSEKMKVKKDRLQKIMIAAMKQSQQCWLPELHGPVPFKEWVMTTHEEERYIGYCAGNTVSLAQNAGRGKKTVIAIGPEGDFSPDEVTAAEKMGFRPVSLGKNRLRTETAGLVACQIIHVINELI